MDNTEFRKLASSLLSHDYKFAKTMPRNPHWYTLRDTWCNQEFIDAVKLLRKNGYARQWHHRVYTTFDVNEFMYWTMDEPIDLNGKPNTILINRAVREIPSSYDDIADSYDDIFNDSESVAEDVELFLKIGSAGFSSVLDIGCGTGLFLKYNNPEKYIGIDPSSKMLSKARRKYPGYEFVNTGFESFYTPFRYELAVALYGTASYIEPSVLERIEWFADEAVLMFYKDGYTPVTYEKTGVHASSFHISAYKDALLGYDTEEWHNYIIARKRF